MKLRGSIRLLKLKFTVAHKEESSEQSQIFEHQAEINPRKQYNEQLYSNTYILETTFHPSLAS